MNAPNLHDEKLEFWDKLSDLGSHWPGPWLLIGDFNMVLSQVEQQGGWSIRAFATSGLSHLCCSLGLVDLHISGSPFTW